MSPKRHLDLSYTYNAHATVAQSLRCSGQCSASARSVRACGSAACVPARVRSDSVRQFTFGEQCTVRLRAKGRSLRVALDRHAPRDNRTRCGSAQRSAASLVTGRATCQMEMGYGEHCAVCASLMRRYCTLGKSLSRVGSSCRNSTADRSHHGAALYNG